MNDMWYYEYEVHIYEEEQHENVIRRGVVCAENYAEAARQIEEYYDCDLIKISTLFCARDCVYEFNGYDTEFKIHVEA